MKQRVAKEQVLALSVKQADQLRSWWKPKEYQIAVYEGEETLIGDQIEDGRIYSYAEDWLIEKEKMLPLLTIGEIFELIHDKTGMWAEPFRAGIEGPEHQWNIDNDIVQNYEVELCDLLWKFVENVL